MEGAEQETLESLVPIKKSIVEARHDSKNWLWPPQQNLIDYDGQKSMVATFGLNNLGSQHHRREISDGP